MVKKVTKKTAKKRTTKKKKVAKKAVKKAVSEKPGLMTQAAFARERGYTGNWINQLVKRGVIKLVNRKVDPEQADKAMEENRDPSHRNYQPKEEPTTKLDENVLSFADAKIKKEHFRAKTAELEYKVKVGELIAVEEVKKQAHSIGRVIRDSLLDLPDRLAAIVIGETDEIKLRELMTNEIREVLQKLSDGGL